MERTYCFADVPVRAVFSHTYLSVQCAAYETDRPPELTVTVTDEDVRAERLHSEDGERFPDGYLESLAFYRKLVTAVSDRDILLFHGSAVSFDGVGYIFTAPSGTGKSTHTRLCERVHGDRFFYINDDKPLLRRIEGRWFVYGTPWDGKHKLSTPTRAPLGGICFLHRGKENAITAADRTEVLPRLLGQTYRPTEPSAMSRVLPLVLDLSRLPLYELSCTISEEAARLSLPTMARAAVDAEYERNSP